MKIDPYMANSYIIDNNKQTSNKPKSNIPLLPIEGIPLSPNDNIEELVNAYGEKALKKLGAIECATCAERSYVDGSDDPGVSFKTPTKVDPDIAQSVVMSHEMEHVSNEQADAKAEDREVVSQSVSLSTALCPECGRSYVSGGKTKTVTKSKTKYDVPEELLTGLKVDKKI